MSLILGLIKRRDSTSILVDDDDLDLSIEGGSGSLTTLSSDDSDVLQVSPCIPSNGSIDSLKPVYRLMRLIVKSLE